MSMEYFPTFVVTSWSPGLTEWIMQTWAICTMFLAADKMISGGIWGISAGFLLLPTRPPAWLLCQKKMDVNMSALQKIARVSELLLYILNSWVQSGENSGKIIKKIRWYG